MTSPLDDDDFEPSWLSRVRRPRSTVELLRIGGVALIAVAGVLVAAWLWQTFRTQQNLEGSIYSFDINGGDDLGSHVPWAERLDAFFGPLYQLGQAGIVFGAGLLAHAAAELLQGRQPEA